MKGPLRALLTAMLCAIASPVLASEAEASALFDEAVKSPATLRMFVAAMPKGGDLHNHLSGTPWAEDYLGWAAQAGLCADAAMTRLEPPPCPQERTIAALQASDIFSYGRLVDALSTRAIAQGRGLGVSGHTQFFSSFDRFGAIADKANAASIATARSLAAGDRVDYLELIHNPDALMASTLATADAPLTAGDLPAAFARESASVAAIVAKASAELDRDEAEARRALGCDAPAAPPACAVTVRYLGWGWRVLPPAQAFRSLILGYAMAASDPRFVGVNLVAPEDAPVALRDYSLHMAMLRFLSARYPQVKLSLHAGELAFGAVPPADLKDHIRQAMDAGAKRIGHGTAIAFEQDATATLARMAREKIAVEINLTSNAIILGTKGADHPLALYRRAGVPVVLSTDDQGILRTDLSNEYARAAAEQGLRYADLKHIARSSLEMAFLPGASLWRDRDIGRAIAACADALDRPQCAQFLSASPKARLQAALERRFDRFENADIGGLKAMLTPRTERVNGG